MFDINSLYADRIKMNSSTTNKLHKLKKIMDDINFENDMQNTQPWWYPYNK